MRPVELHLQAFGVYPGEETVDFAALGALGLFVVSGPTGAGKTTVFDAMAYALFGGLPGDRTATDIRSHHADPTAQCAVELTFEVEGERYRVRRSPEQTRPKKRGSGTTPQAASAALARIHADGTEEPLASGVRPVTEACEALVGLTVHQFERVVLLPQGKFQRFLLAGTADRRPLLQQLFGTRLYSQAVDELKRRAADLRRQVEKVDSEADRHRRNAQEHVSAVVRGLAEDPAVVADVDDDVELIAARLDKVRPDLEDLEEAARVAAATAEDAASAATAAVADAKRWDSRRQLEEARAELVRRAPLVAEGRALLEAAVAAEPVARAADQLDAAAARRAAARRAVVSARDEVDSLVAAATVELVPDADAGAVSAALAQAGHEVEGDRERIDAVRRADEKRAAAEADLARIDARGTALAGEVVTVANTMAHQAARRAELEPVAAEAVTLAAAVERSGDQLTARRRLVQLESAVPELQAAGKAATAHLQAVTEAFVAGAAPRLAATLADGDACPVCGSDEHPAPAVAHGEGEMVDVDALEAAQTADQAARRRLTERVTEVRELAEQLGAVATQALDELTGAHDVLRAAAARSAAAAAALDRLGDEEAAVAVRRSRLAERSAATTADAAAARVVLAAAQEALAALRAAGPVPDPDALETRAAFITRARSAVDVWVAAVARLDQAAGAFDSAESVLAATLAESDLSDATAARADVLPAEERERLQHLTVTHDQRLTAVQAGLEVLESASLPEVRPAVDDLVAAAEVTRTTSQRLTVTANQLRERARQAVGALTEAQAVLDEAVGLVDACERAERVARTCDGQGPTRIGLETWVLAGELERVTEAANVHLARMTGGRYRLERTDDAGARNRPAGLDLAVFDSHTGRSRSPGTLSGGEQFQASLALALGLADVVSLGGSGSGRRFEALFVDEGFGSLDPDALDQAVDALHQIRSSGRMVGVITHVEAMKQQLPIGIEAIRREDGRGSTLHAA